MRFFSWIKQLLVGQPEEQDELSLARRMFPGVTDPLQLAVMYRSVTTQKTCFGHMDPDGNLVIEEYYQPMSEGLEAPKYDHGV